LSVLVNNLKTVSSRLIRRDFKAIISKVYWKPVFWHRSYCIVTAGGAPLEVIRRYIEEQDSPEHSSGRKPARCAHSSPSKSPKMATMDGAFFRERGKIPILSPPSNSSPEIMENSDALTADGIGLSQYAQFS